MTRTARTSPLRSPRGEAPRASPHRGVLVLAVLLLALPLLLGALALGTGGLPHEGLAAASARDVSAAALDRIERFLHGDLTVALVAPASGFELACDARAGHDAPCAAPDAPAAFPAAATAERRL